MGYYTDYELTTDAAENFSYEIRDKIDAVIQSNETMKYAIGESRQAVKWYGWEKDMAALSKQFPEVTFILSGVGEEFPDVWKARIKNGIVEKVMAQIIYPPFSGTK